MKIFKEPGHCIGVRIRKCIGLLVASFFFLGVVAFTLHHNNVPLQLKSCAICKVKTSFSISFSKIKADIAQAIPAANRAGEEIYFTDPRGPLDHQAPVIASLSFPPFFNKAPPYLS